MFKMLILNNSAFQQDYTTQVYAQLEVLVNLVQFKYLVPDTAIVHLDRDTLILYENIVIPVSSISGCVTFPNSIIKWRITTHYYKIFPWLIYISNVFLEC